MNITNWEKYKLEFFTYRNQWIYNWFSNMELSGIEINGIKYNSIENFYQAMKSLNPKDWKRIAKINPKAAKYEGRNLIIRSDWESIKYDIMKKGLRAKFNLPEWKEKLLLTNNL